MKKHITITKFSDGDNCVSFNCPHCSERFKLEVNEFEAFEGEKLYCPYCGLNAELNKFYSDDMMESAQLEVKNAATDLINDFLKELGKKNSKNFKVKTRPQKKQDIPTLYEKDDLDLTQVDCCNRTLKVDRISLSIAPYCPYCEGNA